MTRTSYDDFKHVLCNKPIHWLDIKIKYNTASIWIVGQSYKPKIKYCLLNISEDLTFFAINSAKKTINELLSNESNVSPKALL